MEYKKHGGGYYKLFKYPNYLQVYTEPGIHGPSTCMFDVPANWDAVVSKGEDITEETFMHRFREARRKIDDLAFGVKELNNKLEMAYQ
jgi:hypothetical protein